jgi:hypothetical protein
MAEQTATQESEAKEDMEYWGYLFKPDKCGTEKLNRLLAGIARYIVGYSPVYLLPLLA